MSISVLPETPASADSTVEGRWLLLIHQVPAKPDYVRVKIRRRLRRLGAVALKNAVYALPRTEGTTEDFQWLLREIVSEGGEALLATAGFVEGITDEQLVAMFNADRDADYVEVATSAAQVADPSAPDLSRLRRRLDEIMAIDWFSAPGRATAARTLGALEARLRRAEETAAGSPMASPVERPVGRTWVTRAGIHVDRIASAWLIRRFIDPEARFRFVPGPRHRPRNGELRFDMFDAEFTHEGDRCTFEVLLDRFALREPALRAIAEVVHDIDMKDERFARPETAGVAAVLDGIAAVAADDARRLELGSVLFDGLHATLGGTR